MDDDWLVDYYRRKLLERYTACVNRDSRLKIADMLRTADVETLDTVIQFLELKKQEGAQMPKNSNNASVPTTDAPITEKVQLCRKIAEMTAEEFRLFIYLAEKELGLRFGEEP